MLRRPPKRGGATWLYARYRGIVRKYRRSNMGTQNDEGAVKPTEDENKNITEVKKAGWLTTQFSFVKNKASSLAEDSYGYLGIDEKVEWVKSQASSATEAAYSTKDKVISLYSEAEFKEKYGPYLEKAILTVAVELASETLNDEEQLLKIFDFFIDFIPTPVRILIKSSKADKFIFRLILNMRTDLLAEVEIYRLQIKSSEHPDDEIKQISMKIDNEIDLLSKDGIPQ
jgi:hypothetical protein